MKKNKLRMNSTTIESPEILMEEKNGGFIAFEKGDDPTVKAAKDDEKEWGQIEPVNPMIMRDIMMIVKGAETGLDKSNAKDSE